VEIIIRQMLRKVRITEPGTTEFLFDDVVDRLEFDRENQKTAKEGGQPAEAAPLLQGITKASLSTDSFISAASFQETTRVLTDATANGKVDNLFGFKENVIMGHIIPAGTGFRGIQELKYEKSELELALREKSDFDIDDVKHIIDESEETVKNMPELEEETESETPEEEATEAYPEDDPDKQTGEEE
jgi:DNA-directed RNA polymerase subunit beta'